MDKNISLGVPFIKSILNKQNSYINTDYTPNKITSLPLKKLINLFEDQQKNNHPPILSQ